MKEIAIFRVGKITEASIVMKAGGSKGTDMICFDTIQAHSQQNNQVQFTNLKDENKNE